MAVVVISAIKNVMKNEMYFSFVENMSGNPYNFMK